MFLIYTLYEKQTSFFLIDSYIEYSVICAFVCFCVDIPKAFRQSLTKLLSRLPEYFFF